MVIQFPSLFPALSLAYRKWLNKCRTLAITPTKSRFQQWDEVQRVNRDYTLAGLQAIAEARRSRNSSFRFLYMSGLTVPRDMSKKPMVHGDYLLLRVS